MAQSEDSTEEMVEWGRVETVELDQKNPWGEVKVCWGLDTCVENSFAELDDSVEYGKTAVVMGDLG